MLTKVKIFISLELVNFIFVHLCVFFAALCAIAVSQSYSKETQRTSERYFINKITNFYY